MWPELPGVRLGTGDGPARQSESMRRHLAAAIDSGPLQAKQHPERAHETNRDVVDRRPELSWGREHFRAAVVSGAIGEQPQ